MGLYPTDKQNGGYSYSVNDSACGEIRFSSVEFFSQSINSGADLVELDPLLPVPALCILQKLICQREIECCSEKIKSMDRGTLTTDNTPILDHLFFAVVCNKNR